MHFLLPHFPYFPHYDEGPLFRPYLPLKPFFPPSGSSLHQLHDPAVVQDVRITFIYGIYIPLLLGVYSVRLLTRTTSLQRGPLEAPIAPVACS